MDIIGMPTLSQSFAMPLSVQSIVQRDATLGSGLFDRDHRLLPLDGDSRSLDCLSGPLCS
jgi:hypothetical protein